MEQNVFNKVRIHINKSQIIIIDDMVLPLYNLLKFDKSIIFPTGLCELEVSFHNEKWNFFINNKIDYLDELKNISLLNPIHSPLEWKKILYDLVYYVGNNKEKYIFNVLKNYRIESIYGIASYIINETFPLYNQILDQIDKEKFLDFTKKIKKRSDNLVQSIDNMSSQEVIDLQYFIRSNLCKED